MFFFTKKNTTQKQKLPEKLVSLRHAPQPVWVWDPEYRIIVWSNVSGLAFWNVENRDEIRELIFPENHSMVLICDNVLKKIISGKIVHETITLMTRPTATDFICKLEAQTLVDGRIGILITVNILQSEHNKNIPSKAIPTVPDVLNVPDVTPQKVEQSTFADYSHKSDIMFERPATFSYDDSGTIIGLNDISEKYLNLRMSNRCVSVFADREVGQKIIDRVRSSQNSSFVQKLDIGFGEHPYLIQATQFLDNDISYCNIGLLRISEERYQDLLKNELDATSLEQTPEEQTLVQFDDIRTEQFEELEKEVPLVLHDLNDQDANHKDDYLSTSFLSNLVGVDVGIFDVDSHGTIKMANEMASKLTGYDKEILIGKNITSLFGLEAEPVLNDLIFNNNHAILGDLTDGVHCEYHDTYHNHHIVKLIVRSNPSKNGFWFIVNDNTEIEKIKLELSELKKSSTDNNLALLNKSEPQEKIPSLVSAVSHEIRAPLNAIAGYAEMIETEIFGKLPDNRYREFALSIRGAGEYALSIVNELLDYSKLKAGGFTPQFSHVDIDKVANEAISTIYPQAHARKIEIMKTILTGTPHVNSDARLLKQILINLLTNAIKYSHEGENVLLTAGLTKTGRIMIEVTDFGRGMTEKEIHEALTPFNRGHYETDITGTGLGLSLSKELTELTHGRFLIDSVPQEKTRIRIIYEKESVIGI